jgi:ribosomal protein S18 acetylase RimI-like enzyme
MSKAETFVIEQQGPADSLARGHNGGPPLDEEHTPEWGNDGIGNFFYWKAAHRAAWHSTLPAIVSFRIQKAGRLGLTYEEYTLEILERGRHLQIEDVERIAQIKAARVAGIEAGHCQEPTAMQGVEIKALSASPAILAMLTEILVETVAHGGSVSFMHPLAPEAADAFWRDSLASADRGERVVLGAFEGDILIATVTLLLSLPPNQPHRAEIAKMMTKVSHRHRGIATALIRAAETIAIERGRTLLVLDTAEEDGASKFYERQGFRLTGVIPDYALKPHGGLTGTMIYWKRISETAAA